MTPLGFLSRPEIVRWSSSRKKLAARRLVSALCACCQRHVKRDSAPPPDLTNAWRQYQLRSSKEGTIMAPVQKSVEASVGTITLDHREKNNALKEVVLEIVVRWSELDLNGHVNNAKYVEYLEWGR